MLKKFLSRIGIGSPGAPAAAGGFHQPYAEYRLNFLYNLLFCDDLSLFKKNDDAKSGGPWPALIAEPADPTALEQIAADETREGRVRALAFNRLRTAGRPVPAKIILGVIVEVPQPQGLDVLAAFVDGGVRYLNQAGKVAIFEGAGHPVEGAAKELVAAAQPVVNQIGPWDKPRLAPPPRGSVRMTFLVSDGLYFGQGPFDLIAKDPKGGPVLAKATQLLQRVVAKETK